MNQRIKQTLIQMLLLGTLAPRASWGPANEDQEALGTQDLKSQILGLPVISDYCRSEEKRILPLTFELEVTGSPKIQDFKSCVPRASWSSCLGPREALGTRMPDASEIHIHPITRGWISPSTQHRGLYAHIPCILVARTKASQKSGQILEKSHYTV